MEGVKKGKLLIFSAPSGAGKTTLVKYLMSEISSLEFSISACSRNPRKGETNGVDYYFLSVEEFQSKINNNEFVEWEEVYAGMYYGTLMSEVERIRNKGNHVVFDLDVKGGVNIKKIFGDEALAVFVKPPSIEVLKQRLYDRGTETEESIKIRIERAEFELGFEKNFDITIVNDNLKLAKEQALETINNFLNN
ncbi:MAG: guanylate kinase [Marinilabiliales bacterium]|nr:MAG: guanylate kinase [Marinilabiliales bacterium]